MLRLHHPRMSALVEELSAFVFAAECAGCGCAEVTLCEVCRSEMRPEPVMVRTPGGLSVWAGTRYEGATARVIRAVKENGQTTLLRALAPAVRAAAAEAMRMQDTTGRGVLPTHVIAVPTSAASLRARGYRVPELMARGVDLPQLRALRTSRRAADQRGLDREQRGLNVHKSLRAQYAGRGLNVVVIDDVITTGATFDEAARALRAAGFHVLAGIAAAATPRLFDTRKFH